MFSFTTDIFRELSSLTSKYIFSSCLLIKPYSFILMKAIASHSHALGLIMFAIVLTINKMSAAEDKSRRMPDSSFTELILSFYGSLLCSVGQKIEIVGFCSLHFLPVDRLPADNLPDNNYSTEADIKGLICQVH